MKSHSLTLKDIAKIVGVSVSTVSKSLNNSPEIGADTKLRINNIANLYNYKRNSLAYNLRSKKTNTIGVVIPELNNPFIANVIDGITFVANANNYKLMIYQTRDLYANEFEGISTFSAGCVDGLIISPSMESIAKKKYQHFYNLKSKELPYVMFDHIIDHLPCDKVHSNILESSRQLTLDLIKSGKSAIALLINSAYDSTSLAIKNGYKKAFKSMGIPLNNDLIIELNSYTPSQEKILNTLLETKILNAIISVDEKYAIRTIKSALSANISIPDDLALVTFNGGALAEYFSPSITSVSQKGYDIGLESAKLLLERVRQNITENWESKIVPTETKYRETASCLNKNSKISA